VAVAMFLGSFGVKATLIYIVSGTVLSMIAGLILSRMHLEPYLSDWVKAAQIQSSELCKQWGPIAQIAGWNVLQSLMCTGDLSDSNV
jgi:uncharacterized membrane protein YraQ (UPF0718 family)